VHLPDDRLVDVVVAATALTFVERAPVDLVMVAGQLTLLDRTAIGGLLPACRAADVPVLAAGVFNSGVLARPVEGAWFHYAPAPPEVLARARRMDAVCREAGIDLRTAAMRFPLRFDGVAAVVVGMAAPDEVAANVAAWSRPIDDAVWAALDAI
jgi:D-threo-aldose 1-dehydrogenase